MLFSLTIPQHLSSSSVKMKVLVLLALVGFATAFDFPEQWEAWKSVSFS